MLPYFSAKKIHKRSVLTAVRLICVAFSLPFCVTGYIRALLVSLARPIFNLCPWGRPAPLSDFFSFFFSFTPLLFLHGIEYLCVDHI